MQRRNLRLHDLAGRDVVARAESAKVGTVSDILFAPADGRIGGVLIETAGGFAGLGGKRRAVAGSDVLAIGPDAIVIRDRASIIEDESRLNRRGLVSAKDLKGRSVITDQGKRLGQINDFNFDAETPRVTDYIVGPERGGFGLGLSQERRQPESVIPVQADVTVGEHLVTVPAALVPDDDTGRQGSRADRSEDVRGEEGPRSEHTDRPDR